MAESVRGSESFSSTIRGSEEQYDIVCDFCRKNKKLDVAAAVFCTNCNENLCGVCRDTHKLTSATIDHVFLAPSPSSGRQQSVGVRGDTDPLIDRCVQHPEEVVKFYCSQHQQLACVVCVQLRHRTCSDDDVSYIRDISSGPTANMELQDTLADMKKLVAVLEGSLQHTTWCQQQAEESYRTLVTDIKQLRQTIDQKLDILEKELVAKADKIKKEKLDSLKARAPACNNLLQRVKKALSDLQLKGQQQLNNQLFVATKLSLDKLKSFEAEADKVCNIPPVSRFAFSVDNKLKAITKLSELGTISLVEKSADVKAKFSHSVSVRTDSDKEDCCITGACVLHDGRLAITDNNNKSIKIVDLISRLVTDQLSLRVKPCDVTPVSDSQLAVTLAGQSYVQLVNLLPAMSLGDTLTLHGKYWGLTYSQGHLILGCRTPPSIHVCDLSGQLIQQIDADNRGDKLFGGYPLLLTVSPDKSSIFVTDWRNNELICLSPTGVVKQRYVSDKLTQPAGVTVDDQGGLYVCSRGVHSVHRLDGSCRQGKILLKQEDGLQYPGAIAHHGGRLYVSSCSTTPALCNQLRVYSLQQ